MRGREGKKRRKGIGWKDRKEAKSPAISQMPAVLLPERVRHLTPALLRLPASVRQKSRRHV